MTKKKRRGLIIADFHSGHLVGLSPPSYHYPLSADRRQEKYAEIRKSIWLDFVENLIEPYRPFDFLIVNGDAVDGKGEKSGGTEHITTDRVQQARIAVEIIEYIRADIVRMTYGTKYHVSGGGGEDWEDIIADAVGAKIGNHDWIDVNGRIIDFKHKVGSSTIPHGRLTPLAREILWNRQWASQGLQPKADVLIRSHTHYYEQIDHEGCLGFITPGLQGYGSKFGARECAGTVDVGGLILDIEADGEIRWKKYIAVIENQIAFAERLFNDEEERAELLSAPQTIFPEPNDPNALSAQQILM